MDLMLTPTRSSRASRTDSSHYDTIKKALHSLDVMLPKPIMDKVTKSYKDKDPMQRFTLETLEVAELGFSVARHESAGCSSTTMKPNSSKTAK
jgi:hypothetical protein